MEDTLRVNNFSVTGYICKVLILVLMEDTLRVRVSLSVDKAIRGLNPCFNGRYSQRGLKVSFYVK